MNNYYSAYTGKQIDNSVLASHFHLNMEDLNKIDTSLLNTITALTIQVQQLTNDIITLKDKTLQIDSQFEIINQAITIVKTELSTHINEDLMKWQNVYNLEESVLNLQAIYANRILDTINTIDIENQAQDSGYLVTNGLGGRITLTKTIILLDVIQGVLSVNGENVWTSSGLGLGTVTKTYDVNDNDLITCQGLNTITFTPYIGG